MSRGGVLSFALGIETTAFVNALGNSGKAMFGVLSVANLLNKAVENLSDAFKRGANLWDNHFALNSTVAGLYQLESAFVAVHLPGEEARSMSLRLQRALSGLSETGERTENTFGALGLNMLELRKLDPASQLMKVAEALGKVNSSMVSGLAANLFGRFNYGQALQIARQQEQFQKGFQDAGGGGKLFAGLSEAFQRVLVTWDQIEQKMQTAWAAASKGFIVPFQGLLEMIKAFPWQKIGATAGVVIGGMLEAFKEGKLALLIGETFETGFQLALIYGKDIFIRLGIELFNIFGKVGIFLVKVFEMPINYLQAGMTWAIENAMEQIAKIPGAGKLLGIEGFKADSWSTIMEEQKKSGPLFGFGSNSISDINNILNETVTGLRAVNNADLSADTKAAMKPLLDLLQKFAFYYSRGPQLAPSADERSSGDASNTPWAFKSHANAMEKMGFIFNTEAQSGSLDYARRTAHATEQIARAVMNNNGSFKHYPDLRNKP